MRRFTVEVRDGSSVVVDPERLLDRPEQLKFSTQVPGGMDQCSFTIRRRDVLRYWPVQRNQIVIVYDGLRVVYRGLITDIQTDAVGNSLEIVCQGEAIYLQTRKLRKTWVDDAVISRLVEPADNADVTSSHRFVIRKDKNFLSVIFDADDTSQPHTTSETYYADYYHPTQHAIYNVTGDGKARSGEGWNLRFFNPTGGVNEESWNTSSTPKITNTFGSTPFGGTSTTQFQIRVSPRINDDYSSDDYVEMSNLKCLTKYESGHATATPTYTSRQIIEDGLILMSLLGAELSSDLSEVASITTVLDPFGFERFVSGVEFLESILQISDASFNIYYYAVGYKVDSSNKPLLEVFTRDTSDYEYVITADEASRYEIYQTDEDLANYVLVEYEDKNLRSLVATPTTDATLTDATSVAAYGRRDAVLNIGRGTSTTAVQLGRAYLASYKDLQWQGSIELQGGIRTKAGVRVPGSWVQAGERAYLPDLGITIYIGSTEYREDDDTLTLTADKPPSTIDIILARRKQFFEESA